jgi:two-component system nitrogen regulation response regulator NtrX
MSFHPDAVSALQHYGWPGNIRELRNVVERLMLLAVDDEVDAATVELALPQAPATPAVIGTLSERAAAFERETILAELKTHRYHITNTARALGLERSHLYKKCQQLGIDLQAARGGSGG